MTWKKILGKLWKHNRSWYKIKLFLLRKKRGNSTFPLIREKPLLLSLWFLKMQIKENITTLNYLLLNSKTKRNKKSRREFWTDWKQETEQQGDANSVQCSQRFWSFATLPSLFSQQTKGAKEAPRKFSVRKWYKTIVRLDFKQWGHANRHYTEQKSQ